jgi:hypothetical protein
VRYKQEAEVRRDDKEIEQETSEGKEIRTRISIGRTRCRRDRAGIASAVATDGAGGRRTGRDRARDGHYGRNWSASGRHGGEWSIKTKEVAVGCCAEKEVAGTRQGV